jgi:CspA family cold shock protein
MPCGLHKVRHFAHDSARRAAPLPECRRGFDGRPAEYIGTVMANFQNSNSGPLAMASAKGTVKWYNSTKGYGFITLESGGDAFCHASALAELGIPNIPPGATLICDLQESQRGLQVVAVHSIDISTAAPPPRRGPKPDGATGGAPPGPMVDGKVKFFNEQKGFGFVIPDDGSGDIYLHATALRRSSIQTLNPDQKIRYSTRQGMKGVEVDRIEIV